MLKQCLKNKAHFPLRHLENVILTETQVTQAKKAKLLCCIRKAKLFFLMLDKIQTISECAFLVPSETPGE